MSALYGDAELWLRRFSEPAQRGIRLICFPHAGGAATYYRPLSRFLATDLEVLAVQYPGRQDRRLEPCIDNVEKLADSVAGVLSTADLGPYAFFGHSMGATVAFETARRLERTACGPVWLFASGRRPPSAHETETVHLRDDRSLVSELVRLGGMDQLLLQDDDVRAMVLPAIRADYRAIETYVYTPAQPLRCPITTLGGDTDPRVSRQELTGWTAHTAGECTQRVFSGGHFYLDAHWPAIAALVVATLAQVDSPTGGAP